MGVRLLYIVLFLSFAAPSWPDTGNVVLRLNDVLAQALERNPKIAASRQMWESEEAKVRSVGTWSDPKVGLNLEKIRRGKTPRTKNAGSDMYTLEQDIPFPGKLSARAKAQHHAAKIAEYEYARTVLDVQADVTEHYYNLWELLESIQINRAHARLWDRFSTVSERQYASGKAMQRDVLRAQAEADKISTDLANLEENLPVARAHLNEHAGRPVDSPMGAPEAPVVDFDASNFSSLDSATLAHNVDLKAAYHHIEHSKFLLKSAKLTFIPDFTAGWTRMVDDGAPKFYNASLFLNLPVFFWKQRAEVKAAEAGLQHANFESERTQKEVATELRSAVAELRNAARSARIYRSSILPRSRKTLEVVESGYLANRAGFLDLLDAERQLLIEELTYVHILAEYGKACAILTRVIGTPVFAMGGMSHE